MSSGNVSWRLLQRVKIPPFLAQNYFLFIQKDILMKYGVSLCLAVVSKDYYRQMYAVSYLLPHATGETMAVVHESKRGTCPH